MEDLTTLISDLSETEKSEFIRWIKNRQVKDKTLDRKVSLFLMISENPDVSDRKLSADLFQLLPDNNLMHLKKQTYKSLLYFLYLSGMKKHERENKAAEAERNCHIYLDVARSLMNRGLNENAKNLIQNIQNICRKYELFLIKIKADSLYRECIGNQIGEVSYEEVTHSLRDDIRGIEDYLKVFELRDRALHPTPFMLEQREEYIDLLEESIEYLLETKLRTNSPVIELRYLEVMARYCEVNGQWKESYTLLQEAYRLILEHPALKNEYWTRHITFKLSELALYLKKFPEAQRHITDLMRMTNPRTLDYILLLQRHFRISMHAGNLKEAEHSLEQVNVKKLQKETDPYRYILWQINRACLMLVTDRHEGYKKAIESARKFAPNTKQTPISLVYAECLFFLKTGELDKLEMRVKLLQRKVKEGGENLRWKAIQLVIKEVIQKAGTLSELSDECIAALYFLIRENAGYKWNSLGDEVLHFGIFFSDLYHTKTRRNLDDRFLMYREKLKKKR